MGFIFITSVIKAQEDVSNILFNKEKIIELTNASSDQQSQLSMALENRILKLNDTTYNAVDVNNEYLAVFKTVLTKEQQRKVYKAPIQTEELRKNSEDQLEFFVDRRLPEIYKKQVLDKLYSFEFEKEIISSEHYFDPSAKKTAINKLRLEKKKWKDVFLNTSKFTNKKLKYFDRCDLSSTEQTFIDYNFIVKIKSVSNNELERADNYLNTLIDSPKYDELIGVLANCWYNKFQLSTLKLNTSVLDQEAREEHKKYINDILKENLIAQGTNRQLFKFNSDSEIEKKSIKKAKELIVLAKEKGKEDDDLEMAELLKQKGESIEMDPEKISKVIALVRKRIKDLEALKDEKKQTAGALEIYTADSKMTKLKVENEFSKKISNILNYKQFAVLFGDNFKKNIVKNSGAQTQIIFNSYDELTDKQKKEIKTLVYNYFYKEEILKNFYRYDKKLYKQKSKANQFRFEKNYTDLLKSYNIKAGDVKSINNNTFQWK